MIKKILVILIITLPFNTAISNEVKTSYSPIDAFLQQQEQALETVLQKQKEDRNAFIQKQEKDIERGDYDNWSFPDIDLTQDSELYVFIQRQEDDLDAFIHEQQTERNTFFGRDTPLSCPAIDNEIQNLFDFPYLKEGCPQTNKKTDNLHRLVTIHSLVSGSLVFFLNHCLCSLKSDQ